MIQIFFVFIALCSCEVHAFFSYDTASSLMEEGRWQEAKQQLQKLLIDEPDAPDVLYDAGVASYKTKDYKQARAYFNRATQLPLTKISLKEQSHFNAGNAAAALKDYGDAIKHYEMVLDINASNEKAKHNLEKIKELMQQKQEQQKNDESKESSDDKDQKDQSSDDAQKNMDNEKKKRNEDKSRQDTKDQNKSQSPQDRQQQQKEDPKQQGADADQSNSGKDSQENQGEQKDTRKQEQENHETPSDQQKGTQNHIQSNGAPEKDQGQEGQAGDAASGNQNNLQEKLDERLIRVLDAQEKKDAALNKRMINIAVGQSMGGAQGENCW